MHASWSLPILAFSSTLGTFVHCSLGPLGFYTKFVDFVVLTHNNYKLVIHQLLANTCYRDVIHPIHYLLLSEEFNFYTGSNLDLTII